MSNEKVSESEKAAIAIKTARTASGLNQQEFADLIEVSKTTLARIETFEMTIKLDTYFGAVKELKKLGIEMDAMSDESITIKIIPAGQSKVLERWSDVANRRSDRKQRTAREKEIT